MKICTMFTGGTIGSVMDETGYIGPKEGTPYRVLELYQEQFGNNEEWEIVEPYRILSENLAAENIICLVKEVNEVLQRNDVDGVIITHGTDTLQYGSALLGYIFGNVRIPIVVVSSNYVLEDERANGLTNFQYAVEFIKEKHGTGVFVSYCNKGEFPTIHRATRLQPLIPCSDHVASVQDSWYGRYEKDGYVSNPRYKVKEGGTVLVENPLEVKLSHFSEGILYIRPYVGMRYPEIPEGVKVVLHGSYHSGTINIGEELQQFMEQCRQRNITVYLTGVLSDEKSYETVKEYQSLGVCPLYTSSEVAAYCKLWLALSNDLDVKKVMGISVAEDWISA